MNPKSNDTIPNPWPGLVSYSEDEKEYFFGRDTELKELSLFIKQEPLTTVFGKSGSGKTSLMRAGIFPRLREENFFPIRIRLDYKNSENTFAKQVKKSIISEAQKHFIDCEDRFQPISNNETLWEYLHRVDFWNKRNQLITPVFVIDQFEEYFSLGKDTNNCQDFITELGDCIENRVPEEVRETLFKNKINPKIFMKNQQYRFVLVLREDYVSHLDTVRNDIPSIMYNRFKLATLDGFQAFSAVWEPGKNYMDKETALAIVQFVATGKEASNQLKIHSQLAHYIVEPAHLSVLCHELFNKFNMSDTNAITEQLLLKEKNKIILNFYERSLKDISENTRIYIEDHLLTQSGFRSSLPEQDAIKNGLPGEEISQLIERRLLQREHRFGVAHLEFTHDLLIEVVTESRKYRVEQEAYKQKIQMARKKNLMKVVPSVIIILCAALGIALYFMNESSQKAKELNQILTKYLLLEGKKNQKSNNISLSLACYAQNLTLRRDEEQSKEVRDSINSVLKNNLFIIPIHQDSMKKRAVSSIIGLQGDSAFLLYSRKNKDVSVINDKMNISEKTIIHENHILTPFSITYYPKRNIALCAFREPDNNLNSYKLLNIQKDDNNFIPESSFELKGEYDSVFFDPSFKYLITLTKDGHARLLKTKINDAQIELDTLTFSFYDKVQVRNYHGWITKNKNKKKKTITKSLEKKIISVAFNPTSTFITTIDKNHYVDLWDLRDLEKKGIKHHQRIIKPNIVWSQFSPSHSYVLIGQKLPGYLQFSAIPYNNENLDDLRIDVVESISDRSIPQINLNNKYLLVFAKNRLFKLYDISHLEKPQIVFNNKLPFTQAVFSPDSRYLFTSTDKDSSVSLWDLEKKLSFPLAKRYLENPATQATFSHDSKFVLTSTVENLLALYRIGNANLDSDSERDISILINFAEFVGGMYYNRNTYNIEPLKGREAKNKENKIVSMLKTIKNRSFSD